MEKALDHSQDLHTEEAGMAPGLEGPCLNCCGWARLRQWQMSAAKILKPTFAPFEVFHYIYVMINSLEACITQ